MIDSNPRGVLPGPVRQLGYVVSDLDAALSTWLGHGVGPWFTIREMPQESFIHRGEPTVPVLSIAFANTGPMQIELIQQHDASPSAYQEFLDVGGEGFHHLGFWADDFDATTSSVADAGWAVAMHGAATVRFEYYDARGTEATMLELMELNDSTRGLDALVSGAAAAWDGRTDPVRSLLG